MSSICCCIRKNKSTKSEKENENKFENMTQEEKKAHIDQLWNKARRYNNKLRFQARLQKMTESNLKEMMIDDINDEAEDETTTTEPQQTFKWYLIDRERTFCKVWNMMITLLLIYNLFVAPYVLVFMEVYEWCEKTTPDGIEIVPWNDECEA